MCFSDFLLSGIYLERNRIPQGRIALKDTLDSTVHTSFQNASGYLSWSSEEPKAQIFSTTDSKNISGKDNTLVKL